jgi:hypothetical protein
VIFERAARAVGHNDSLAHHLDVDVARYRVLILRVSLHR